MSAQREDPFLDACLEEVLGGQTPPDLSGKIMAAWHSQARAADLTPASVESPRRAAEPMTAAGLNGVSSQPIPLAPKSTQPAMASKTIASKTVAMPVASLPFTRVRRSWLPLAAAASVLLAATGYLAMRGGWIESGTLRDLAGTDGSNPAQSIDGHIGSSSRDGVAKSSTPAEKNSISRSEPETPAAAGDAPRSSAPALAVDAVPQLSEPDKQADPAGDAAEPPASGDPGILASPAKAPKSDQSAGHDLEPRLAASASSDAEVVEYINEFIRQGWQDGDVQPSEKAADAEWCRRVFLDVLGRIPTADETRRFVADRSGDKRLTLVNALLDSDEYVEDFARNWTSIWTNILIGRSGGLTEDSLISREGLQQYLRRSFLKNKPYDQFVRELVSAEGASRPGVDNYDGAVNFVLDNLDEGATPATAKTARIFLGLQVQCTQCHNHPFNDWKQNQFWELNAFFRQAQPVRKTDSKGREYLELADRDFLGEGNNPDEAEIYFEQRNGLLKVALPRFVDGQAIGSAGSVDAVNRRDELARLIVGSDYMNRAIVNRMWGHFLGYGFTKPIDDMGPHNAPSHPELLDRLGGDFAAHGYDLKQLIRWMALSEPYSLSSKAIPRNRKDDPEAGTRPLFSRFYLRQMRAEELYNSLLVATRVHERSGDYASQERIKAEWLNQFTIAFGTDENDEATTFNGSIPQALMMWNGDLVSGAVSGERGSFLHQVAYSEGQNQAKISQLFTAALARKPTKTELGAANELWRLREGDTLAALQDIWWAVLNSNEFILNH